MLRGICPGRVWAPGPARLTIPLLDESKSWMLAIPGGVEPDGTQGGRG